MKSDILIANMSESEQIQAGSENVPTASQYRALLEISESIARHRDFASLLRDLAMHLRSVVQFDGVSIVLYDAALVRIFVSPLPTGLCMRTD
ncbi:MAG: hypothetical protein WBV94_18280 [Blastocatellia bacterium]